MARTTSITRSASISFNPPASNGGSTITGYLVTSIPDSLTGTGPTSPIVVRGLVDDITYTFTVRATNVIGSGPESVESNPVTPHGVTAIGIG